MYLAASGLSCSLQDLSLPWLFIAALWHLSSCSGQASVVAVCGLSCPVACRMSAPQPGVEPISSALEGIFLTTGPPEKSFLKPCILSSSSPNHQFTSVQSLSHVRLFVTPWTAAHQGSLSITNSQSLLKLLSIESVMPSNHLILCCPLLLLPSIFPSIRVFSNELVLCIMWPEYCSFSFSISPSNEYSGLISFRIDRLDLLAIQGTLKSLFQHHNSKASILGC